MNLGAMITAFRREVDDTAPPYLWSDAELMDHANEAEREACRRARLLMDSSTAAVCQIAVSNGTATYALDSRVIFIRRARLASETDPLVQMSYRDLDEQRYGWEDDTGTPTGYVLDWETGKLRFDYTPDADNTLNMTVIRDPLVEMNDVEDSPEINERYHRSLIHWMKYRAYTSDDDEKRDDAKAARALAWFEQEFGQKSAAIDEVFMSRTSFTDMDGQY